MKTISPSSLEELCLNFICANLEALCYGNTTDICGFSFESLSFKSPLVLHEQLVENIIKLLSYSGKLTSRTASLFIDPKTCRIRKFYLRKCQVDSRILKLLFSVHRIAKLDLSGATVMSSSLLLELLNEMSSTVRELNLSNTLFNIMDFSTVQSLKCLTHLDISNTPVDDRAMFTASQHLNCLQCVNISGTEIRETASFGNLRGQLRVLLAYNTPLSQRNSVEFTTFGSLQKLDISRDPTMMNYQLSKPSDAMNLQYLFTEQEMMPALVYLDVSGFSNVKECDKSLQSFFSYHPKLQFLGLFKTGLSSHAIGISSCIEVTGDANEQQILSSLRAYSDRVGYMVDALREFFRISKNWTERKPEVLQLILSPMEKHPEDLRIQIAATACIFNIVRGRGATEGDVHPTYLSKIAGLVLTGIKTFPDKPDLLRNCLLILESRQILKKATFNYFEACSQAMGVLCHFSGDNNIAALATKLCAILSSKISAEETISLGSERNIETMFNITQAKISANQADFTLTATLSVLWNLTDEAPSTCLLFVQKGGLQMMTQAFKVFKEGIQEQIVTIKKKLLGTLNNIAEVTSLRQYLITDDFMDLFGSLLQDRQIELSYFCGGILSNIMLEWSEGITLQFCTKQDMLHKLEQAVQSWEFPAKELVAYRSFSPFVPLLHCSMPAVQMWSLWGLHHVCSRNGPRYIPLLVDSGVMESVQEICNTPFNGVNELAQMLLNTVTDFQSSRK